MKNFNDVMTAVDAHIQAQRNMYDALLTAGHEDTGIQNRNGDEPGVTLIKDVEFTIVNRLKFLARARDNRRDWSENSDKRADDAETLYLSVESVQEKLNDNTTSDKTEIAEFGSILERHVIAQRYKEIANVRYQILEREYVMLAELHEEMFDKPFVFKPTEEDTSARPSATTMDPKKLKEHLAAANEA